MLLPAECLEQLKCSLCERLLSRFPIYVTEDKNNQLSSVCGRCEVPSDGKKYLRNTIYESAMKNVQFPCINREHGCMEYLSPENIEQHESLCQYQTIECIICDWQGRSFTVFDHYRTRHTNSILKNYKLEINIERESLLFEYWRILLHKETIFVFQCDFGQDTKRIKCTLIPIFSTRNVKKYYAQINLIIDNITMSNMFPEINIDKDKSKSIDFNIEKLLNDSCTEATVIIIIANDIKELSLHSLRKQNEENLSNSMCNLRLDASSRGMVKFDTNLQSSSNQLLNLTYHPCQYGCQYATLSVSKLEQHYNNCLNRLYNCLFISNTHKQLTSCDLIRRQNLRVHINKNHPKDIVALTDSLSLSIEIEALEKKRYCKLLSGKDNDFILTIQHVDPHLFLWRVEVLQSKENINNFTFKITMSNENDNAELSLRKSCAELTLNKNYNINDIPCMWLHLDQVHQFINNKTLSFKIMIYNGSNKLVIEK